MKKEKDKLCLICKKKIIVGEEEYCKLIQYYKDGKLYNEGFYHVYCFSERFLRKFQVDNLVERTNKLLQKAEQHLA